MISCLCFLYLLGALNLRAVEKIEELSERLIYGVGKEGLPLSRIRLRGLGRTYITQLVMNGYDTPEAIAEIPQSELERIIPKRLAERLSRYCKIHFGKKEEPHPQEIPEDKWEKRPLSEILSSQELLSILRSRLTQVNNLSELIHDPPLILIDEKQMLLFYKGYPVQLPPTTFKLMLLLSKRPGEVITRDEIYSSLYPDSPNTSRPYDRQISDHKRKILTQIKKALNPPPNPNELRNLIKTRRKVGYVLTLKQEGIKILK